MRILLLSMPDVADAFEGFARMPNLGLASLAGSLDGHQVRIVDLVAFRKRLGQTLAEELAVFQPQLLGLTGMTFQFPTLLKVARFCRRERPELVVAAGGYHATAATDAICRLTAPPLDFLIRGEGEATIREWADAFERVPLDFSGIRGLSYRIAGNWVHNPARPPLNLDTLPRPRRDCRRPARYYFLTQPADVVETSRGCPHACRFCSIGNMYGRSFRAFPLGRVLDDLRDVRSRGARIVFFSDDNITHDVPRFRELCRAIVREGLNDLAYIVQITAAGVASDPELARDMARANFQAVFVGFEAMDANTLRNVKKPTSPEINRQAAAVLKRSGIGFIAGCVFGWPEEDSRTLRRSFELVRRLRPDLIFSQYLTPYPGTALQQELQDAGLVANPDRLEYHHGMHCNVRSRFLSRSSLHRRLRFHNVLSCFDPRLIWGNRFLKRFPLRFTGAILFSLWRHLYGSVVGRQPCDDFKLE